MIEAITEDLDGKLEMWGEVDAIVKPEAFFATNTSSLSVADQAAATGRPERFLGLHFFNPAQVMPLLEVVRAEATGDEAYELGFALGEKLGKTTVAAGDNRGFIVNRLLVPYMLDAIRAYEQGVGSIEDIDRGMIAGASHPMGPLTLSDFVGLDTLASIADVMADDYGEDRFAQPETLRKLVERRPLRAQVGPWLLRLLGRKPVPVEPGVVRRGSISLRSRRPRPEVRQGVDEHSLKRIRNARVLGRRARLRPRTRSTSSCASLPTGSRAAATPTRPPRHVRASSSGSASRPARS